MTSDSQGMAMCGGGRGCDQAGIAVGGSDGLGTNQTSDNTGMAVDGVGWGHGQAGQLENDLIVGSDGQSTSMTGESPGMCDQAGIAVGGRDLSVEDEKSLRWWARKLSNRSFGILKLCRDVIDMNETMLNEMPPKRKLKENLKWSQTFERNYEIWKTTNIKFLNLKESSQKHKGVRGENKLVNFCETKGGMRVKENWEEDAEAAANVKEYKLKFFYERKKSMKSKKRKFELVRECQNTMTGMLTDWRMTLHDAEDKNYQILKEKLMKERSF
jgi:hypothetical protein